MRLHYFLYDCETKSSTSGLRARSSPETIEDAIPIAGRDARSPIGYAYARVAMNTHKDFGTSRGMADRIFHQISDRVGDRMSVGVDTYRSLRDRERELSRLDQSPGGHGRHNAAGDLIELDDFADIQHHRVQPRDTKQLLDQPIHASDVGLEFDEIVASLLILERSIDDGQRRP